MKEKSGQKKSMLVSSWILLCVLMLFLPAIIARGQEASLLSHVQMRPAAAGTLDAKAREIPIVYALYRRRFFFDSFSIAAVTEDTSGAQIALLREKAEELEKAGVLTEALADEVWAKLAIPPTEIGAESADGFSAARWTFFSEEKRLLETVYCWWHAGTGCVVNFSADIDTKNADAAAMLSAYRDYLGLDGLDDWQDIAQSADHSACLSKRGQIYLSCCTQENQLMLSAVSLSPEEAETVLQQ